MFSVWAIAFSRARGRGPRWVGPAVLAGLALAVCTLVYAGVWAALQAVEELRTEYEGRHLAGRPHPALPRIVGDPATYHRGRLVPLLLPPLFMAAWCFVLLLTFL